MKKKKNCLPKNFQLGGPSLMGSLSLPTGILGSMMSADNTNPMMSAIGGGLTGFSQGGILGGVLGLGTGLISGINNKSAQAQMQYNQNQARLGAARTSGGDKGYYMPQLQKGGKVEPYVTNNPNDPRIQAYRDSLNLYKQNANQLKSETKRGIEFIKRVPYNSIPNDAYAEHMFEKNDLWYNKSKGEVYPEKIKPEYFDINRIDTHNTHPFTQHSAYYKKPRQEVILEKRESVTSLPQIDSLQPQSFERESGLGMEPTAEYRKVGQENRNLGARPFLDGTHQKDIKELERLGWAPKKQMGGVAELGYSDQSPYKGLPYITIPGNKITMKETGSSLLLIPDKGKPKLAQPYSGTHVFPGATKVLELPLMKYGGFNNYQMGGEPQEEQPNPVQTEKGEIIGLMSGGISKVGATKLHKHMNPNQITDILPPGSYVFSDDKFMKVHIKEAEDILGYSPIEYGEDAKPKIVEHKLADVFGKNKKLTPAQIASAIKSKFPTTGVKGIQADPFTIETDKLNTQARLPYLQALIGISERKKPVAELNDQLTEMGILKYGGYGKPLQFGGVGNLQFPGSMLAGIASQMPLNLQGNRFNGFPQINPLPTQPNSPVQNLITQQAYPDNRQYSTPDNEQLDFNSLLTSRVGQNQIPVDDREYSTPGNEIQYQEPIYDSKRGDGSGDFLSNLNERERKASELSQISRRRLDRDYRLQSNRLAGATAVAGLSYALQNSQVDVPQYNTSALDAMETRVPQSIFNLNRSNINRGVRPMVRATFENTPYFNQASAALSTLPGDIIRGQSELAGNIAMQNMGMRNNYLAQRQGYSDRVAENQSNANNQFRLNQNSKLSGLGNVAVNQANQSMNLFSSVQSNRNQLDTLDFARSQQFDNTRFMYDQMRTMYPRFR